MTDRELMQMALDALDLVTDLTSYDDEVYEAIDALRARLAQPEPEPVAWWDGVGRFATAKEKDWDRRTGGILSAGRDIPLYTAPPQREWQGLTTQEIADETDIATSSNKDIFDLRKAFWCGARWAEDKLKEKNS